MDKAKLIEVIADELFQYDDDYSKAVFEDAPEAAKEGYRVSAGYILKAFCKELPEPLNAYNPIKGDFGVIHDDSVNLYNQLKQWGNDE